MKPVFTWICFFVITFTHQAFSQKKIKLQQLSTENGLSQNTINCIFQDSKGFMWFGTHNGLNHYDGYSITVFKNIEGISSTLQGNDIYSIAEDQKKNLWIGTSQGLSLFDQNTHQFINYDFIADGNYTMHPVWCILPSRFNNQQLWVGASGGLYQFNTESKEIKHYKINDSIQNSNSIGSLLEASNGDLWIGTFGGGLLIFDKKLKKFKRLSNFLRKDEIIRCIIEDKEKNIWIGNDEGILRKYDYKQHTFISYNDLKGKFPIRSIIEDRKGNIWIGTDKGGAYVFNKEKNLLVPLAYEKENGNDVIRCMLEDQKGNIWLGTYNGGAHLYDNLDASFNYIFPYQDIKHSNENNSVLSIFQDANCLWLGTDGGGLIKYKNGEKVRSYRKEDDQNSIADNIILCIAEKDENTLCLGTYSNGLLLFDKNKGTFTHYRHSLKDPSSLSDNSVWVVYNAGKENLWIGTNNGGLNLMNTRKGVFKHFTNNLKNPASISSNTIRSIFKDSNGKLWIGTVLGLDIFNEKDSSFSHFIHDPLNPFSISNNNVLCIYEDSKKNLWFGTHGGGLNLYDKEKNQFITFDAKNGLGGNIIYGILEDQNSKLWLSTNKGIFRFDPENKTFKAVNTNGGFSNLQFNVGAYGKNDQGELLFGTTRGLCTFNPKQIKTNTYLPPIVLTDFLLFNKSVEPGPASPLMTSIWKAKKIVLDYKQSVFSFVFSALNYTHSEKNQYAYKLEGFDKDWNYIGTRRSATYTNLEPGYYTFKVKGSNNDNVWNEKPASIVLIIHPPLWKTLWFKFSCFLSGILFIGAGYVFNIRRIRNQKKVLQEIINKKTREIEEKNLLLYETERQNAFLLQQKLNHELTNKSQELTNYILLIIQKNQLLEELRKKVKETIKSTPAGKSHDFRKLLTSINLNFNLEKEWSDFNLNFTLINKGFAQNLKDRYPDLTNYDLRLCALYRIGISSNQISEVMGISLPTLKMARYRLRKKLGLSPEEELTEFLRKV